MNSVNQLKEIEPDLNCHWVLSPLAGGFTKLPRSGVNRDGAQGAPEATVRKSDVFDGVIIRYPPRQIARCRPRCAVGCRGSATSVAYEPGDPDTRFGWQPAAVRTQAEARPLGLPP